MSKPIYSDEEVTVTPASVTYRGETFQVSSLPTVAVRNTGPGCAWQAGTAALSFFAFFSVLGAVTDSMGAAGWLMLLFSLAGLVALVKAKPANRWQVWTKIGLDEKTLYWTTEQAKAEAVYRAIQEAVGLR